jgi:branched-chain amino acid transport system permease protein
VDWAKLVELTVNGITLGGVYALIALGYSMVYGILKLLNFAHGDVYMIGAFIGYFVLTALGGALAPVVPIPLLLVTMFAAAMIGCGLLGVGIERFAYRPLRNAPRIAPLISALGVSFLLENSALLCFGAQYRSYNTFNLDNGNLLIEGINIGPLHVSIMRMIVIGLAVVVMAALVLYLRFTRLGRATRAVGYDREAAEMMGVDIDRIIAITFFIGSALAGLGGVMVGLIFENVYHFMGFIAGLKGFTAAVVGGIGSVPGAMLGGLFIGLAEAYAVGYLPQGSTFQDFWVFVILIVMLLIRPVGLLGRAEILRT